MTSDRKPTGRGAISETFAASFEQTYLRIEERLALGKAMRDRTSRKSQSDWNPPKERPDPIDLVIENNLGRVENLIPIRYGRMASNPFAFYRGAAAYSEDNQFLMEFLYEHFGPEMDPAIDAWITQRPLKNPNAPPLPFAMEEYYSAA